jgi:hypothetical protein
MSFSENRSALFRDMRSRVGIRQALFHRIFIAPSRSPTKVRPIDQKR